MANFKAASLTEAYRKARKLLHKKLGDDYKKRDRDIANAVSYITVYQNVADPTSFTCFVNAYAPCHGSHLAPGDGMSMGDIPKRWIRCFNVSLPAIRNWEDEAMKDFECYLDYLINRSFVSHVYKTKRVDLFIEQGAVVNGGGEDITLVHFALVAGRIPREYPDVATVFRKLVEKGVNEHLAFPMACFMRFKSVDKESLVISDSRGHMMLAPRRCHFINFLKVKRVSDKNILPYTHAQSYMGVDAQFGVPTSSNMFATWIKDLATETRTEDAWGDVIVESAVVLDDKTVEALNKKYEATISKK